MIYSTPIQKTQLALIGNGAILSIVVELYINCSGEVTVLHMDLQCPYSNLIRYIKVQSDITWWSDCRCISNNMLSSTLYINAFDLFISPHPSDDSSATTCKEETKH